MPWEGYCCILPCEGRCCASPCGLGERKSTIARQLILENFRKHTSKQPRSAGAHGLRSIDIVIQFTQGNLHFNCGSLASNGLNNKLHNTTSNRQQTSAPLGLQTTLRHFQNHAFSSRKGPILLEFETHLFFNKIRCCAG